MSTAIDFSNTRRGGRMVSKDGPHATDVYVGGQIRSRRTLAGMSQSTLAEGLNLTFQQVQKYERGANRVGASRLLEIAQILDVPISYFFEGLEKRDHKMTDLLAQRKTLELVRCYHEIPNARMREGVYSLIRCMAGHRDD